MLGCGHGQRSAHHRHLSPAQHLDEAADAEQGLRLHRVPQPVQRQRAGTGTPRHLH